MFNKASDKTEIKKPERTSTEIAHAWQDFRTRCVQMAIDAKATALEGNIISTASSIADYIMNKSPMQIANEKSAAESTTEEEPE